MSGADPLPPAPAASAGAAPVATVRAAPFHPTEAFTDPHAALERMRVDTADVFLLDIGLPDMDGYELAQRLRQRAGGARATFIAITGYGQESDRGSSLQAGFSYHFVKPVDTLELARLLATLAEKPRA